MMHLFAFAPARKLLLAVAALVLALPPSYARAQDDPPDQAGRVSYVSGAVSIQQAGSDEWGRALPNLPLGPGDRVVTDFDGRAEIQVGQTFLRIGPNSDVSFVGEDAHGLSFGLAQGQAHVHCLGLWPGQRLYVNTPSGSGGLGTAGDMRVDVLPNEQSTIITTLGTQAFAVGAGGYLQTIYVGRVLELIGSNPVYPLWLDPTPPDDLDRWSMMRDRQMESAASYRYVSPEIPGAYELDAYGTWLPDTPYGNIWFPSNVPAGWAPYHYGHWVNHAPWGWVWVEDEPWGYAPFHYGRWVSFEGRWGWIPGAREAHPVWSPALVVFAGGGHPGGGGVSAWFPLGPGEVYHPWYHASPHYIDQVNITNIHESERVHVQNTYVNVNVINVTYVNRTSGASAVSNADFAAGRPVHQASVVVDAHAFDHIGVQNAPNVPPPPHPFAGNPPQRPVKLVAARPALINEQGKIAPPRPGAPAVAPPVQAAPPVHALPGRTVAAPPLGAQPAPRNQVPAQVTPSKPVPATPAQAAPAPPTKAVPQQPVPANKPSAQPFAQPSQPANKPSAQPFDRSNEPANKPSTAPWAQQTNKPAPKPSAPVANPPAAAPVQKPAAAPFAPPAQKPAPTATPTPKPAPTPAPKPTVVAPAPKPTPPSPAKPAVAAPAAKPAPPATAKPQHERKDDKKDGK
jgi:hypothetical protein